MRLDKYLKVSRLIKRRELAKEFIDHNFVLVNDKIVKPSYEVKLDDKITIISPSKKELKVKVKEIKQVANMSNYKDMYEIIEE